MYTPWLTLLLLIFYLLQTVFLFFLSGFCSRYRGKYLVVKSMKNIFGIGLIMGMWLSCAELKHFIFASVDPLEWWVHTKGYFFLFFFGKRERLESKTVSPSGVDIKRLLDSLAAKELTWLVVFVSKVFENLK